MSYICDKRPCDIVKEEEGALKSVCVEQHDMSHIHISVMPAPGMSFGEACRLLAAYVSKKNAAVVSVDVLGVAAGEAPRLHEAFGTVDFPVTWIEGIGQTPAPLWGVEAWAVVGPAVAPITASGRVIGSRFETAALRYCRLGGVMPEDASRSRTEQTRSVFEQMCAGLAEDDMTFGNVVRTWFYNRDMLEWYDEFNVVRTSFFKEYNVFAGGVPASTGIGARGMTDAALTAGLIAFSAKDSGDDAPSASVIPSPLQCPALDYGSSFSRAIELYDGAMRWLFLSGTASIEKHGASVHLNDVKKQIALTFDVAHAILDLRRMDWRHVNRAIAYFKHREDAPALEHVLKEKGIDSFPLILANTDICRDDLLFEIELDAIDAAHARND